MRRKNQVQKILEKHYADMLNLNRQFISSLNRPRGQLPNSVNLAPQSKKKLTKKQKESLARGREVLAFKRAQKSQQI